MDFLIRLLSEYGPRIVLALVILFAGLIATRILTGVTSRVLTARKVDAGVRSFTVSVLRFTLKTVVILSAASTLGIAMTSFVAIVGAAGLAIALAFQGSLSNFAGGLLILIFKPFAVGNFIEVNGIMGTVQEIQMLYTIMDTFDNKRVVVPNGSLANSAVTNFSVNETRRIDLNFGVSYDASIDEVKTTIHEVLSASGLVLKDPAPLVGVTGHGDSAVVFLCRFWVDAANFMTATFAVNEEVKKAFDAKGIRIPFPQRDVNLYQRQP
ncbi:MAG: mechanosensitive ion channel family protein [Spirochaetaceae bacterium]